MGPILPIPTLSHFRAQRWFPKHQAISQLGDFAYAVLLDLQTPTFWEAFPNLLLLLRDSKGSQLDFSYELSHYICIYLCFNV